MYGIISHFVGWLQQGQSRNLIIGLSESRTLSHHTPGLASAKELTQVNKIREVDNNAFLVFRKPDYYEESTIKIWNTNGSSIIHP